MKSAIKKLIIWIVVLAVLGGTGYALYATGVIAQVLGTEYSITFVVDGKEYVQKVRHGQIPEFDGSPEKEGDNHTEYVFDGWEPTPVKATKDTTYTAKFASKEKLFEIVINPTIVGAADFEGNGKIYKFGDSATLKIDNIKNGFIFEGWYIFDDLKSTAENFQINNISKDLVVEAKISAIKKSITYTDALAATNSNQTTYDVRDGVIVLRDVAKNGYKFLGWYTQSDGGEKVEQIDSSLLEDVSLFAHWEIETYHISYELNGGLSSGTNPNSYTIETPTFTLTNPTKDGATFLGWNSRIFEEITTTAVVPVGTYGDIEFVAIWDDLKYSITFVVDGDETFEKQYVYYGANTVDPNFDSASAGMGGYTLNAWYRNAECTQKFEFGGTLEQDIVLYGKWGGYFLDSSFCKYYSKFITANTIAPISLDSEEELVAWIDFVKFYNITDELLVSYNNLSGQSLVDAFSSAVSKASFPFNGQFSSTATGKRGSIFVTSSSVAADATQKSTEIIGYNGLYTQQDYAYAISSDESATYFNIDKLTGKDVANIETTNQLYYALEHGAKPVCKEGSIAKQVYTKAKEILAEITNDEMSDVEKLEAIYEWLVLNVQYDNFAAANLTTNWTQYRSWYAEGAILDKVAVCDGIAKAFVIFAQIENIPCVRVSGQMNVAEIGNVGHAWNKVFVNGNWFGVDATHGNVLVGEKEILSYTNFMFTDAFKEGQNCFADNHIDLLANTVFNFYESADYEVESHVVDLLINNKNELHLILKNVEDFDLSEESTYFTVEVAFADGVYSDSIVGLALIDVSLQVKSYLELSNSSGQVVYLLFLQKKAHI